MKESLTFSPSGQRGIKIACFPLASQSTSNPASMNRFQNFWFPLLEEVIYDCALVQKQDKTIHIYMKNLVNGTDAFFILFYDGNMSFFLSFIRHFPL